MPNGYTRQDTTGALANGNPIDADLFNNEYNALESAMNASTGHNHDGTTGGGATINKIGPSNELEVESGAVFPKVNDLIDHGKTGLRWKDAYYAGTVFAEDVSVTGEIELASSSGWVIYQSGTDLKFKYNGTDRFKLTSAGALTVEDNVTAFGSA
tara:strand:+ start:127 stop:591 length:465 start_codon:yes stop_codon:yes gene_type:complete